jgi:hypothetical protein
MRVAELEELRRRIDEVLFYVWDPLAFSPSPHARDEFRRFVPKIFEMLTSGRDAYALAAHLSDLESGMLAAPADEARARAAAELMIAHRDLLEGGTS